MQRFMNVSINGIYIIHNHTKINFLFTGVDVTSSEIPQAVVTTVPVEVSGLIICVFKMWK